MAFSDCEKCWETPCECGYDWETYSTAKLDETIRMLQEVRRRPIRCAWCQGPKCGHCQGLGSIPRETEKP